MKACHVVAKLEGPPSINAPIHLDSLLYAARERMEGGLDMRPLDCLASTDGVFMASAGFLLSEAMYGASRLSERRVWRFRMEDARYLDAVRADADTPGKARRIGPMSPLRNRFREQALVGNVHAVAWTFVGDPDKVMALLRHVDGIGASSGTGRGRVHKWSVEAGGDDATAGLVFAGKAARNLPIELAAKALGGPVDVGLTTLARVAPPYWDKTGHRRCVVPTLESLTMDGEAFEHVVAAAA